MPTFEPFNPNADRAAAAAAIKPMLGASDTKPNTADLAKNIVCVDLTLSKWTARKIDRNATDQVTFDNGADADMAHVSKRLVVSETLNKIVSLDNQWSLWHRSVTIPYSDNGMRMLPTVLLADYETKSQEYAVKRAALITEFVQAYPAEYVAAKAHLGKLWNEDDYPPAHQIADKFRARYTILPFPSADHFVAQLTADQLARAQADMEATLKDALAAGQQEIYKRMLQVVKHVAEALAKYEAAQEDAAADGRKGRFHDNLTDSVFDLIQLIPALNVTADPTINSFAMQMIELMKYSAAELRANDTKRAEVRKHAADILKSIQAGMVNLPAGL